MNSFLRKIWKSESARAKKNIRKRGNKVHLEVLEPRVLLSADTLLSGVNASLTEGLTSFSDKVQSYVAHDLDFAMAIPGVLQTQQDFNGDGTVDETEVRIPTEITVAVDFNRDGTIPTYGSDKSDLAGVYGYIQDSHTLEQKLSAMDLNNDRVVDWGEAYDVLFVGAASKYLAEYEHEVTDPQPIATLENDLRAFLDGLEVPTGLSGLFNIELSPVSVNSSADLFGHEFTIALTLADRYTLDLGLEADRLEITMPEKIWTVDGDGNGLGTRTPVTVKPEAVLSQTFSTTFAYNFDISGDTSLTVDEFSFFAEDINFSRDSNDNLSGLIVNVGFLGTQADATSKYELNMDFDIEVFDPSSPANLGFADSDSALTTFTASAADGVLMAANAPRAFQFNTDIVFTLKIGTNDVAPVEVTVTAASMADNDDQDGDTAADDLEDLRDDLQSAIEAAHLDHLISAGISGDKLALVLVQTDASPLGFGNETYDDDGNGTVVLTAANVPQGTGDSIFEFTQDIEFLLSINGALPKLITIAATDPAIDELHLPSDAVSTLANLVATSSAPSNGQFIDTDDPGTPPDVPPTIVADNKTFTVTVNTTSGSPVTADITVLESAWSDNASRSDLVADINNAISGTTLNGKISASLTLWGQIVLSPVGGTVTSIKVTGPNAEEFGFTSGQASYLAVTATSAPLGELSSGATFDVIVNLTSGESYTRIITVSPGEAGENLENYLLKINLDLLGSDIHAIEKDGRIVLEVKGVEADDVASFEVKVPVTKGNTTIDDLVDDINQVLSDMGITTVVAQVNVDKIELVQPGAASDDPIESLEITRTLTMGAENNITHQEWTDATSEALFEATPDTANDTFDLVLNLVPRAGINFTPDGTPTIEAHLEPFTDPIAVAEDDSGIERFELPLTLTKFDQYLDFNVIGPGEIVGLVTQLIGWLDRLPSTAMLGNFSIPFAKAVLGDVLDFGDLVEDKLLINDSDDGVQPADVTGVALMNFADDPNSLNISFDTAQELTARLKYLGLLEELGEEGSGIWADYDEDPTSATYRQLLYHLQFMGNLLPDDPETPFNEIVVASDFSLDLAPFSNLYSSSKVSLMAYGYFDAMLGIAMGDAKTIADDTTLASLYTAAGKTVLSTINTGLAITGADDVSTIAGRLTSDQYFTLNIFVGGEALTATVKVTKASTATNMTFEDLRDDINAAIAASVVVDADDVEQGHLDQYLTARLEGAQVQLVAVSDGVESFLIASQSSATSRSYNYLLLPKIGLVAGSSQLGLVTGYASSVEVGAYNPIYGDLIRATGGAQFVITLDDGTDATLNIAEDVNNITLADLINDINAAIVGTDIEGKIQAVQVDARIVFKAIHESVTAFKLESTGVNKLGFTSYVASPNDGPANGVLGDDIDIEFTIFTQSGLAQTEYPYTISILKESTETNTTLDDLIKDINKAIQSVQGLINFGVVAERGAGETVVFRSLWSGGYGDYFEKMEVKVSTATNSDQLGFIHDVDYASSSTQIAGVYLRADSDAQSQTGRLSGDATFGIMLNEDGVIHTVTVTQTATKLNTSVADLVADINRAIDEVAGLEGKIRAEVVDNFRVVLRATDLSVGSFILTAAADDPAATEIGFADTVQAGGVALLAAADVAVTDGVLTDSASFDIALNDDPTLYTVTIDQADTALNASLDDLVADINAAIAELVGLNGLIRAELLGGERILLRAVDPAISSFSVTAVGSDTAVTELGFGAGLSASFMARTASADLRSLATKDAPSYMGIGGDASFTVSVTTAGGTVEKTVFLDMDDTIDNASIFDLIGDLNRALNTAFGGSASNPFIVGNDGLRLVISPKAGSGVTAFSITADAANSAITDLMLHDITQTLPATGNATFVANQWDLLIRTGDGSIHAVTLDGCTDIADVIHEIETQTGGAVQAVKNKSLTGLNLIDKTLNYSLPLPADAALFQVDTVNGSGAALSLGIFAADVNSMSGERDGIIEGQAISPLKLADRLYLHDVFEISGHDFDPNTTDLIDLDADTLDWSLHGLATGDRLLYSAGTGGTAIGGLTDGATYYAIVIDGSTLQLAAARQDALDGSAMDLTGLGTGTEHSLRKALPMLKATVTLNTDIQNTPITAETPAEQLVVEGNFGFVGVTLTGGGTLESTYSLGLKDPGEAGTKLSDLIRAVSQDLDGDRDVDSFDLEQYLNYPTARYNPASDHLLFDIAVTPDVTEISGTLGTDPEVIFIIQDPGNPFAYPAGMNTLFDPAVGLDIDADTLTLTGHGLNTGDRIVYRNGSGGADIGGLVNGTAYYVIKVDNDTLQLATTRERAEKLMAVDLTSIGSGSAHKLEGYRPIAPTIDIGYTIDPLDPNNIGSLVNFTDITFTEFLNALKGLNAFLQEYASMAFLDEDLPLIGVSVNDLVGIAERFNQAVIEIEQNQAGSIQLVEQKLAETFGLPVGSDFFSFKLIDDGDGDSDLKDMLQVTLNFSKAFSQALPLNIDLTDLLPPELGLDSLKLLGTAGLGTSGSLNAKLTFGVDLDTIDDIYLFTNKNDTGISGSLHASADNLAFNAALGSLGVYVKEGNADFTLDFGFETGAAAGTKVLIGDALDDFSATLTGSAEATLPVFFPSQSSFRGDIDLAATFGLAGEELAADIDLEVDPEIFTLDFSSFNLFDNIALMIEAGDLFLSGLQDVLDGEVFGFELPIVGDKLSAGADFIEDFRLEFIQPLRDLVESAPEKGEELITQFLFDTLKSTGLLMYLDGTAVAEGFDWSTADIEDFIQITDNLDSGDAVVDFAQWNFVLGQTFTPDVNFDFDLGFDALGLDADVGLDVEFAWSLGLGFGISLTEGAYIDIGRMDTSEEVNQDTDPTNDILIPELQVTITAGLTPTSEIRGQLLFLELVVEEGFDPEHPDETGFYFEDTHNYTDPDPDIVDLTPDSDKTQFYASFSIDLFNSADKTDRRLALSELGSLGFDVALEADAEVNLDLRVQFNEEMLPSTVTALLPAIETGFVLDWQFELDFADDFGASIGDALADGLKYVAFTDTYIDLGSFLGQLIVPLVDKIQEVTEPLQPIIDVVTARIPVLSDLAGRTVTLVDLAATFGEINPDLIYAIADIISFVNSIPTEIDSLMIKVADEFIIYGSGIVTGAQLADPNFNIADNVADSVFSSAASQQLFDAAGNVVGSLLGDSATGNALKGLLGGDYNTETDNGKYGFAFPILEDLGQVFGLLLGKPAVLVTYDLPPFFMDFTMEMSFPIYPPLYGVVSAGVGLQIDFAFGYDTQGIQDFIEGGATNPLDLLSGLYISDTDRPDGSFGTDVPELKLWGGIGVGAELNLGIASAGVMADISITFNFDLYDPDSDGRVRITELVGTFMNEINNGEPAMAPLSIFDIYGDIAFQLSAYIEILFARFDFDITPRIVIWEFEIPFERPPILATERGDGSLLLNIGPNSGARLNGDTRDIDEDIYVRDIGGGEVEVWGMGVESSAAQVYKANSIYAYGGEGNDIIDLSLVGAIPVHVEGGSGNDLIKGGGKDDNILGGVGDDTIYGGGGKDNIWGEAGYDEIHGGAGNDIIFGDGGFVTDERITALGSDGDGNDTIYGDGDTDIIFGGGGDDHIYGGDNAGGADGGDILFGDSGRIELLSDGSLPTLPGGGYDLARMSARGLVSGNDLIFGNAGADLIFAGKGNDIVDGGADNDLLFGNEGFDTVYGGGGEDSIYGGTEDDRIFGGRDDLVAAANRDVTDATADLKDLIYGEDGNDFIRGNLGNDTIHGQRGADIIFGDEDNDIIYGEGDPDFIFGGAGADYIEGQTGSDYVFGDDGIIVYVDFFGDGSHKIIGLVGGVPDIHTVNDTVLDLFDSTIRANDDRDPLESRSRTLDLLLTLVNGATDGEDTVIGGEGDDIVLGGAKDDTIFGDLDPEQTLVGPVPAGKDILFGDGGRVQFYGRRLDNVRTVVATDMSETGADTISGNGADDLLLGGGGNDVLYGRMDSAFSGPNENQTTVTDNDIIIGDDGEIDYTAGTGVIEKIATTISANAIATGGVDTAYGNRGDDIIFGGMKGDILYGDGSTGGDDIILGDNGQIDFTGGVIDKIFTTDTTEASGGADSIDGQAGNDIILGGVNNDDGLDDPEVDVIIGNLGDDVILGDNGLLDFAFGADTDLTTLDLIQSEIKGLGGEDHISGNAGEDVIIGSTGCDLIYGDDAAASAGAADGEDIILGDNGIIRLKGGVEGRLEVRGTAVKFIHTSDEENGTGGADTISGNAMGDVIIGGVNGPVTTDRDVIYGDAASPGAHDGQDVILGDNGLLHFAFGADTDLTSLDLVATRPYAVTEASILAETFELKTVGEEHILVGGNDLISGNEGNDVLIGGVGDDEMYGDNAAASSGDDDGEDIMLGDNARIELSGTDGRLLIFGTAVDLITTTDTEEATGGADTMSGNAGNDIMLGGVNNDDGDELNGVEKDLLYGDRALPDSTTIADDGDDIMLGDNGFLDFTYDTDLDRMTLDLIRSEEDGLGGIDVLSGGKGLDVGIGGTAGDTIYGDDADSNAAGDDLGDLLLGDNADIFLKAKGSAVGGDVKTVLDSAVYLIRTTDKEHPEYGGSDTISGNADGDIIAGGVFGDTLYGDRLDPTTSGDKDTTLLDGDDIMLGDNGAFEWLSTGRFEDINPDPLKPNIDISANNSDLWNKYEDGLADDDLSTLDLVTTEQPTSGGRDLMYGDNGRDMMFGGTDSDEMYGDDGTLDEVIDSANNDLMFGDHGRLYPQFSTLRTPGQDWRLAFNSRNFFAIDVGDADDGEGDRMWGEEGDDGMLGQQGDDRMWGGSGNDDMTGGHNVSGGIDELSVTTITASLDGTGIATPAIDDVNDLMDGGTGDDAMAGDNAIVWRRGDDLSPRFRELTAETIYTTSAETITANVDVEPDGQSDPDDAVGRDIELVDHADSTTVGLFGADVMAGGADNDVMFGQLANDLMQGDGTIGASADPGPNTETVVLTDTGIPDTSETLYFNIPEAASDGDDYLEGNGGGDLMYGGLGQDDIIGGSSALFGLTTEAMRPDGSDVIFGGAGIDIGRNANGDANEDGTTHVITTSPEGHALDADYIMGDNANVYRLVNATTDAFLTFNYDNYGTLKIIPRAMQQLDYTLGGADFADGSYTPWGAANNDNGMADEIHGEAGDDIIFGMTGSDVIFGEGQDDDIIGGYGNDWISGGTGQDGVLGDDGLILTSRNSDAYGESLYGIDSLLPKDLRPKYADGNVLNEIIYTPGSIQYAVINVGGELKKTMDLVPFSFDPDWTAMDDEFPDDESSTPYADDIIFGGLGSDWLHGGSGDDAISGAEALDHAWVPVNFIIDEDILKATGKLDLGYAAVGIFIDNPMEVKNINPGNVLAFNIDDIDGQHLNNRFRAGEFFLYNEYDPRRMILLTSEGNLYEGDIDPDKIGVDYFPYLLNFNELEGVLREDGYVPKATGQQTEYYPEVRDDGRDAIFGDNGNDWLVGGTGRDDMYGGWGNDLLNADDDHTTNNSLNDIPDTHPFYEDRAYGGAGRDVLIGNTGGDRLIDWVGEYNSYLVPYAPFGAASVSRTLQPFLPEFLYALSAGDGADFTRPGDTGASELRNGEPDAELGLVLQKDFAWQDQTGAPADPQAGNIPGGARDVLRTANFNDGTASAFFVDSGVWTLTSGRYQVAPTALGGDALSVFFVDEYVPSYFEMMATIRAVKPTGGYGANSYLIFDYQSAQDFKFAGINVSTSKLEIGYRDATGWHVVVQKPYTTSLKTDTDYNVFLALNGSTATLRVNNKVTLTYTFATRTDEYGYQHFLNEGMVGLGAKNAKASIDNVVVQRIAPETTLVKTVDFSSAADFESFFEMPANGVLNTTDGVHALTAAPGGTAIDLVDMRVAPASVLSLESTFTTANQGGFVFDYYGPKDFKFVAVSVETGQVLVGHSTDRTGIVVDSAWTASGLTAQTASTLGITISERSVSVTLNGQGILGFAYNALVTDGAFGLLARNGAVLFDRFTLVTDDPAFAAPALPDLSVSDATVTEGNDGTRTVTVRVTLSAAAASPVSVAYATADGTATAGADYEYAAGVLTFAAGETSKDVEVRVSGDTVVEPDETFSIVLSDPVGATIADGSGTVGILNDDIAPTKPIISISGTSVVEGDRTNKTKVTVVISLSQASTETVSVKLSTQNGTSDPAQPAAVSGSDYVAVSSATVTFLPGETKKTYTLTINGDKVAELDEVFSVVLANPVGGGATIGDGTGVVTILNDDGTPLTAAIPATGEMEGVLATEADLAPIVDAAIDLWAGALGEEAVAVLHDVEFQVGDLSGQILGLSGNGTVFIDADAAGYGWFVDPTPLDDSEFTGGASDGMDLLTAVMHEFGHVLGFRDVPAALESLMSGTIEEGVRRLPSDLAMVTMPATAKSSLLNFAPPSNGIPSGWIFEHGKVADGSGHGWLGKLLKRFTGRTEHGGLPDLITLTGGAALHNPVEGVAETAEMLVRLDMANTSNLGNAALNHGKSWQGEFLLDGTSKANPNKGIKIVI